jgi:hypothetical protein
VSRHLALRIRERVLPKKRPPVISRKAKNKLRNPLPVSERTSGGGSRPPVEACILEPICTLPLIGADAVSR